jgi:Ca2+:H+ antiporter
MKFLTILAISAGLLTASLVTTSGRSAWFVGVLAIMAYLIFATALYLLPPVGTK